MISIQHPDYPAPQGHYSPAIVHQGLVYVSGQLPRNPINGSIPDGIIDQTTFVMENLRKILQAADSDLNRLISVRIYIDDIENWGEVNKVYERFLGNHRPARCVVPVNHLHYGCLLEVEAIAAVNPI